jgi:putative flavoprotein involved in K+ transport
MTVDCVVVGGGPAGLTASAALTERGVEHEVLEAERVGQSWRTQRWNSFRLNTPGWLNHLFGELPREAYLDRAEVIACLQQLARTGPGRHPGTATGSGRRRAQAAQHLRGNPRPHRGVGNR